MKRDDDDVVCVTTVCHYHCCSSAVVEKLIKNCPSIIEPATAVEQNGLLLSNRSSLLPNCKRECIHEPNFVVLNRRSV